VPALKNRDHYPVLVIGTGIAGLTASFCLAGAGIKVLLVTKAADPKDCNTFWAQGGIIYEGAGDTPAKLIDDIIAAGAGLSNEEAVRFLAVEGPRVVKELLLDGCTSLLQKRRGRARSDAGGGSLAPRIIHSGDATGRAIETRSSIA
jgi:L-aspartate oxidase